MKHAAYLLFMALLALPACAQQSEQPNKRDVKDVKTGDGCEDCEAIYECPVPFNHLNNIDTLPGFDRPGPKIEISGTVYKRDGVTPAAGVVLYVYHTDQQGIYPKDRNSKGPGSRHGYIRGWIKTDTTGRYRFYTLVPASYPNSNNPKHIHVIVKEPGKTEYWIDDFYFADDPLLPKKAAHHPRGGNGIVQPAKDGLILKATRNIQLGENVPGYKE